MANSFVPDAKMRSSWAMWHLVWVCNFCLFAAGSSAAQTVGETVYKKASPAVVTVRAGDSSGSGFLVRDKRTFITAAHVIKNGEVPVIQYGKSTFLKVSSIAIAIDRDVAVLVTEDEVAAKPIPLGDHDAISPGAQVFAIGTALGQLSKTLTDGTFSGLRKDGDVNLVQVSCPFSPGMSGGPILTKDARVIGVVSFSFTEGQNLNIAVAAKHIRELLEEPTRPVDVVCAELKVSFSQSSSDSRNETPTTSPPTEVKQPGSPSVNPFLDKMREEGRKKALADLQSTVWKWAFTANDDSERLIYDSHSMADWKLIHSAIDSDKRKLPLITVGGEEYDTDISGQIAIYCSKDEFDKLASSVLAIAKGMDDLAVKTGTVLINKSSGVVSSDQFKTDLRAKYDASMRIVSLVDDFTRIVEDVFGSEVPEALLSPYDDGPVFAPDLRALADPDRPGFAAIRWVYPDSKFHVGDTIVAMKVSGGDWVHVTTWRDVGHFLYQLKERTSVDVRLRSDDVVTVEVGPFQSNRDQLVTEKFWALGKRQKYQS